MGAERYIPVAVSALTGKGDRSLNLYAKKQAQRPKVKYLGALLHLRLIHARPLLVQRAN